MCDVSEAFTQTAAETRSGARTVLRPPSALKHMWCEYLRENGFSDASQTKEFAFLVENSIYGERDAPLKWALTLTAWLTTVQKAGPAIVDDAAQVIATAKENMERTQASLVAQGFKQLECDSKVYVRVDAAGSPLFVFVYVDDVIAISPCVRSCELFFDALRSRFRCTEVEWVVKSGSFRSSKDAAPTFLTDAFYFDEVAPTDTHAVCHIDQEAWLVAAAQRLIDKKVISKDELEKPLWSLSEKHFSHSYLCEENDSSNPLLSDTALTHLRSGINTLSYLASHTRAELVCPLSCLARGQTPKGRFRFLQGLLELIRYAWTYRTRHITLRCCLQPQPWREVTVECDADSSLGDASLQFARMGYNLCLSVLLGDGTRAHVVVAWKCGLQTTVSVSSTEAEIVCASWASRALMALHFLMVEVARVLPRLCPPDFPRFCRPLVLTPLIYQDNEAAQACASGGSYRRLRHLSLHNMYVRHLCCHGQLRVLAKRTAVMSADLFTKVLANTVVERLLACLFRR